MSLDFQYDKATILDIVYHQVKEVKDPIRPFVRCPCLKKLDLLHAYKCLYCGIWFCEACAEKHFGKTKAEHLKEKEAQSDE